MLGAALRIMVATLVAMLRGLACPTLQKTSSEFTYGTCVVTDETAIM
jgi:hypothetical protein